MNRYSPPRRARAWLAGFALLTTTLTAQTNVSMGVDFKPIPKRVGQTEWLKPVYPAHWPTVTSSTTDVAAFIGLRLGATPFVNQHPMSVPASEQALYSSLWMPQPHRYAYTPDVATPHHFSFFIVAHNSTLNEYAWTNLQVVDITRVINGPVVTGPCVWDGYSPTAPLVSLTTSGDVWVDAVNGNDNNSGLTSAQAVQTLGKGAAVLRSLRTGVVKGRDQLAGKTMILRGGVYSWASNPVLNKLELNDIEGAAGNPVLITAYGSEVPILDGFSSGLTYGGFAGIGLNNSRHVVVENLTIRGWVQEAVNPDNTENVTLRHLRIHNIEKWGIQAYATVRDLVIEGCYIHGIQREHGIYISGLGTTSYDSTTYTPNGQRVRISFNDIAHTGRHAVQVNGTNEQVLINNNRILQTGHYGIQCTFTPHLRIWNNLIAETDKGGISIYTDYDTSQWANRQGAVVQDWMNTHFQAVGDIEIAYNTIRVPSVSWTGAGTPHDFEAIKFADSTGYEENAAGAQLEALVEPFFDVSVHDNIFVTEARSNVRYQLSARLLNGVVENEDNRRERMLEGIEFRDNIHFSYLATGQYPIRLETAEKYFNGSVYQTTSSTTSLTALPNQLPGIWSNLGIADPQFTAPTAIQLIQGPQWWPNHDARLLSSDYRLQSTSLGVDSGVATPPGVDVAGLLRNLGSGPDRGAHESH